MKRHFEEFTGRATKVPSDRPRLTLQRNGKLSMNDAAIRALGNPATVVLLYDSSTRSVGLRAASKGVPHAYPVMRHGKTTATMTIIAFAKHYGIDLSTTRSYEGVLEDNMLTIELDKGVPSGRTASAKGSR